MILGFWIAFVSYRIGAGTDRDKEKNPERRGCRLAGNGVIWGLILEFFHSCLEAWHISYVVQIYQKQFMAFGDNSTQNNEKRITHISGTVNRRGEKFKSYSTPETPENSGKKPEKAACAAGCRRERNRMWCVLYGKDGDEEKTEAFVKNVLPKQSYSRCFHPIQHKMMRHGGAWRDVCFRLFPGYVFIETDDPETVYQTLKRTPRKLLFCDEDFVSVLSAEDARLLDNIMDEDGQIRLSVVRAAGKKEDGSRQLEYLSGPLGRVSSRISRVSLHKRIARVETGLAGERKWINLDFCFEDDTVVAAKTG